MATVEMALELMVGLPFTGPQVAENDISLMLPFLEVVGTILFLLHLFEPEKVEAGHLSVFDHRVQVLPDNRDRLIDVII